MSGVQTHEVIKARREKGTGRFDNLSFEETIRGFSFEERRNWRFIFGFLAVIVGGLRPP
jgi:hypothetical protein